MDRSVMPCYIFSCIIIIKKVDDLWPKHLSFHINEAEAYENNSSAE